jgi:hypothetical protein
MQCRVTAGDRDPLAPYDEPPFCQCLTCVAAEDQDWIDSWPVVRLLLDQPFPWTQEMIREAVALDAALDLLCYDED